MGREQKEYGMRNWYGVNLYVENLIPGLITVPLLLVIVGALEGSGASIMLSEFLGMPNLWQGFIFLAVSYTIGAFVVLLSRFPVDYVSSWWPRPFFLRHSRRALSGTRKAVNAQYSRAISLALEGPELIATEVLKRRERGRIVRSSMVPLFLAIWIISDSEWSLGFIIAIIISFLCLVVVYAYGEVAVYQAASKA